MFPLPKPQDIFGAAPSNLRIPFDRGELKTLKSNLIKMECFVDAKSLCQFRPYSKL